MAVGKVKQLGLMYWCGPRSRGRIAGQDRVELNVRRAQERDVADVVRRPGNRRAVQIHAEVLSREIAREVRAAFQLQ